MKSFIWAAIKLPLVAGLLTPMKILNSQKYVSRFYWKFSVNILPKAKSIYVIVQGPAEKNWLLSSLMEKVKSNCQ